MSPQPDIIVREARLEDVQVLVRLNSAMARETENKSLDLTRLQRGTEAVFGAPEKGFYLVLGVSGFGQFWVREIGVKKLLV